MKNDMLNISLLITYHSHADFDVVSLHLFLGPFIQSGISDHNNYRYIMSSEPMFVALLDEGLSNIFLTNNGGMVSGEITVQFLEIYFML